MMIVEFNSLKPVKYIFYILFLIFTSCSEPKPSQVTFPKPPQGTFDVPALIGKNIDEVRKVLGKPTESDPDPPRHKEKGNYSCFYDRDNQTLGISYNPYTRRIKSFQIVSSEEYDNVNDLLKLGNLHSMENLDYRIEIEHPIFTRNFRSITVILK